MQNHRFYNRNFHKTERKLLYGENLAISINDQLYCRRYRSGSIMTSAASVRDYYGYAFVIKQLMKLDNADEAIVLYYGNV